MLVKEDSFVPRRELLDTLGIRSANLSNVLTLLLAHKLVERRDRGKEAEFRLTHFGRQLLESEEHPTAKAAPQALAQDVDLLARLLGTDIHALPRENTWFENGVYLASLALPKGLHGPVSTGDLMQDEPGMHAVMPRWCGGGGHVPATTPLGYRHGCLPVITPLLAR